MLAAVTLGAAAGWTQAEEHVWSAVELTGSVRHDFVSRINGGDYRIFLYRPDEPAPPAGFPVLYLLDGGAYFPMLAELARLSGRQPGRSGVSACVVVGLGYPPEMRQAADGLARRFYDLTPPVERDALPPRPGPLGWPEGGGAALFSRVVEEEVKPLVESRVSIDRTRQTLIGHSLGGLFTLRSLFTGAGPFQRYVAGSPSIWFNDRQVLEEAENFLAAAPGRSRPALLMTVGGLERSAGPGQPPAEQPSDTMVGLTEALAARLAEAPDRLDSDLALFPDETHLSIVPSMLSRALRFGCTSG